MIKRSARIFNSAIFKDTKCRSRVLGLIKKSETRLVVNAPFLDDDSTGEPKISWEEENAVERGKRDTELERDSCRLVCTIG